MYAQVFEIQRRLEYRIREVLDILDQMESCCSPEGLGDTWETPGMTFVLTRMRRTIMAMERGNRSIRNAAAHMPTHTVGDLQKLADHCREVSRSGMVLLRELTALMDLLARDWSRISKARELYELLRQLAEEEQMLLWQWEAIADSLQQQRDLRSYCDASPVAPMPRAPAAPIPHAPAAPMPHAPAAPMPHAPAAPMPHAPVAQAAYAPAACEETSVEPPRMDSVRFSAVVPKGVERDAYLSLDVFMYEDAFRHVVDAALSQQENTREAGGGYGMAARNSRVQVVLWSPDLEIPDGTENRIWCGKYLDFSFVVWVPEDYPKKQIFFRASVYINDIIATRLNFTVACTPQQRQTPELVRQDIKSGFISYAHEDVSTVAAIVQGMQKARPDMDLFFDIDSLRSGEDWEATIREKVISRDVLFLCWSLAASRSDWVDQEWRCVFDNKGESAIEPVPIDLPSVCPPPAELQKKHFNDRMVYVIKATQQAPQGAYLIRLKTDERFPVIKDRIVMGKSPTDADCCIRDNGTISRRHAVITRRSGSYFIADQGSMNRTYVDGKESPSGVETPIVHGTRIRLSDEEFVFCLPGG